MYTSYELAVHPTTLVTPRHNFQSATRNEKKEQAGSLCPLLALDKLIERHYILLPTSHRQTRMHLPAGLMSVGLEPSVSARATGRTVYTTCSTCSLDTDRQGCCPSLGLGCSAVGGIYTGLVPLDFRACFLSRLLAYDFHEYNGFILRLRPAAVRTPAL